MKLLWTILLIPILGFSAEVCNKNLTISLKFTPTKENFSFTTIARDKEQTCLDVINEKSGNYRFEFLDRRKNKFYEASYLIPRGVFYDTLKEKGSDQLTGGFSDQHDIFRLIKVPFPNLPGKVTVNIYQASSTKLLQSATIEVKE